MATPKLRACLRSALKASMSGGGSSSALTTVHSTARKKIAPPA